MLLSKVEVLIVRMAVGFGCQVPACLSIDTVAEKAGQEVHSDNFMRKKVGFVGLKFLFCMMIPSRELPSSQHRFRNVLCSGHGLIDTFSGGVTGNNISPAIGTSQFTGKLIEGKRALLVGWYNVSNALV